MAVASTVSELPSPPELVTVLEESHCQFLRQVAGRPAESSLGPVRWFHSSLPSPLLNGCVWAGDAVGLDSLGGIATRLVEEPGPSSLWIPDRLVTGQTARDLISLGLERTPPWSGVALDLRSADQTHEPSGAFLVQESHDLESDRLFTRTWNLAGVDLPEAAEAVLSEHIESARAHRALRPLIAWSHAAPAAVCLLAGGPGYIAVHGLSTLPAVRRHGIASSLVLHALKLAHAEGARYAVAVVPPAGAEMLAKLGFLPYTGWERFEWRPENAV
ncbi:MAG: GNAT family N-acetyltransferase [Thermoplasmata archaeon]|nr:GNAT family N-acetyltransferase [Thermoplasmata archaeon]